MNKTQNNEGERVNENKNKIKKIIWWFRKINCCRIEKQEGKRKEWKNKKGKGKKI